MSSAISESSTFDATVTGPDDGDARNAASVRVGLGNLTNRSKFLNDNKYDKSGGSLNSGANVTLVGAGILTTSATGGSTLNGTQTLQGPLIFNDNGTNVGYIAQQAATLGDSDSTLFNAATDLKYTVFRVPTITANRSYTFSATNTPVGGFRKRVRIVRMRTADAFTVTVKRSDTSTIGVISASAQGWIDLEYNGSNWVVGGWGGTVTSLLTTE